MHFARSLNRPLSRMEQLEGLGLKCFFSSSHADDHKSVLFSAALHPTNGICVVLTSCGSTTKWLKLSFSSSSASPAPEELTKMEFGPLVWGKAVRSTYYAAFDIGDLKWTESHERTREAIDYCVKTQQHHLRPSDPPSEDFHRGWYRVYCRDFSKISDPDHSNSEIAWNENCSSLAFGRHFSSITAHDGKIYFWCWRSLQALVFNPPKDPKQGKGDWGCLSPYPREFVESFLRRPHNFHTLSLGGGLEGDRDKILLASRLSENQYTYDATTRDWGLFQHPNFSKNVFNVDVDAMISCGRAIFWIDVMSNHLCCYDLSSRKYLHGPMAGLPIQSHSRSIFSLVLFSEFVSVSSPTSFCVIWTEHSGSEVEQGGELLVSSTTLHYCIIQAHKACDDPDKLVATLVGRVFGIELAQYFVIHDAFVM